MSQQGYGVGGVFRSRNIATAGEKLKPILGEIGKIGAVVGADLLKNMVAGVIDGKSVKEAARESGKQAGKQSIDLVGKRAIEAVKKPPKRVRSESPPKEKKKPKKQKTEKKQKKSQKGGRRKRRIIKPWFLQTGRQSTKVQRKKKKRCT